MEHLTPVTFSDLKEMGLQCANPTCTHDHRVLYMHPACHPMMPTYTWIDLVAGTATVVCAECEHEVIVFQIAA